MGRIEARLGQFGRQRAGEAIPEQRVGPGRGRRVVDDLAQRDRPALLLARPAQDAERDRAAVGGREENLRLALAGKRSAEHTSELQSLLRISTAVFSWKKKTTNTPNNRHTGTHQQSTHTLN